MCNSLLVPGARGGGDRLRTAGFEWPQPAAAGAGLRDRLRHRRDPQIRAAGAPGREPGHRGRGARWGAHSKVANDHPDTE